MLGGSLPNFANICLHNTTTAKFNPFTESDKVFLEKICKEIGGPSIVFTGQAVVDETFIQGSTNCCKTIAGKNASYLYAFSLYQTMPTGLYARWELDSETGKFKPRQNKTKSFENMVMSYFQRVKRQCKVENF